MEMAKRKKEKKKFRRGEAIVIFPYLISRIWNLIQLCVVVFIFVVVCLFLFFVVVFFWGGGWGVVEPVFMGSLL